MVHPTDWEGVELALSSTSAIEHLSLPYDPASRRLLNVPVVVSNAQAAGVAHALASDSVGLDSDNQGISVTWDGVGYAPIPLFGYCTQYRECQQLALNPSIVHQHKRSSEAIFRLTAQTVWPISS